MNILISVVIPVYNGEKYIRRCLNAIKRQKTRNFEVVFVDDGSRDSSKKIIKEFMNNNIDISYQYIDLETNRGIPTAKNTGMLAAKGKYVMFHDQDDWMSDDCLLVLEQEAARTNEDKIVGRYAEINENGEILREIGYRTKDGTPISKWLHTGLHAVLFKRDILINNNIRVPDSSLIEDGYFNSHFAAYINDFAIVDKVVFYYCIRYDSTSGAKNNNEKWNPETLFKSALECYTPLYKQQNDERDKTMIEYAVIKVFYWYLLHNNRYSSVKKMKDDYNKMKKFMLQEFPRYLKNKNIKLIKTNHDRSNGQKIVYILTLLDRFHLLYLFFCVFILVSKTKYLES